MSRRAGNEEAMIRFRDENKPAIFSEEGVEVQAPPRILALGQVVPGHLLHGGEIVILALKPSIWFLVFVSVRWLFVGAAMILLAPVIAQWYTFFTQTMITQAALVIVSGRLIVALLQWSSRLYILTNRRVMSCRGVMQVTIFEAPLVEIRNTCVRQRRVEKIFDVGSVGLSLSEAGMVDSWWEQIPKPHDAHDRIRRAIQKARDNQSLL